MILAAGRGSRMHPYTDNTPKPLLKVGDKPLIAHHLTALAKSGVKEIIINVSHLAEQIQDTLGRGCNFGVNIHYSIEPSPLETAGGIIKALPLLGQAPFIVMNADVWTDYPLERLLRPLTGLAHIVLVDNPEHNLRGDYGLEESRVTLRPPLLTLAGIGLYHPQLFTNCNTMPLRLATLLEPAILASHITGEHYQGQWIDVGTPERLALAKDLASRAVKDDLQAF